MSIKRFWQAALLVAAIVAGFAAHAAFQGRETPAPIMYAHPEAVLLWFGSNASAEERYDGSAAVTGGTLLAVRGRHFSNGDSVSGNQWRAVTRRDAVAPFADIHYTEMRPGSVPEVRHQPVGVFLYLDAPPTAGIKVDTAQGAFEFVLSDLRQEPRAFLQGKVLASRVPFPEKLTTDTYEDDEPAIASLPGSVAVSWVAYKDGADRVLVRTRGPSGWQAPEEVTPRPADIFRSSLAATPSGVLWVFWSQRDGDRWFLWGRAKSNGTWAAPERISEAGSSTFHRAAASADGTVYVVWQSFRDGQSDIYLRAWRGGVWQPEARVSESRANDWEPAVAASSNGTAFVAWDSYDKGNYDIHFRSYAGGKLSELKRVTEGPRFQAHATVAADPQGRPWLAWDEGGVNWGKDQGFLIPVPLATPLHQQRWVKIAFLDGDRWQEPWPLMEDSLPPAMKVNAEHPQLLVSKGGSVTLAFRHWTRRNSRTIGSPIVWENYLSTYDGQKWSYPAAIPESGSWIEKLPALTADDGGELWAAWMTDNRPFATMIPANTDVYAAKIGSAMNLDGGQVTKRPYVEPFEEAIPVHNNDAGDVRAIRAAAINSEGKTYHIYRGDMHRHTDISQDFKYDGSLFEVYRYALDAASFDYIAPTDHQAGYDQEYSWWQGQKYADLFHVSGYFVPLFAYERSLRYPNGHRNVVWAKRGFRTLPVPPEEASGQAGAGKLYEALRQTGGISMPHSTATDQGTDWRDNDPQVEPLMEIFQGYRNSYEYEGAPRSATTLNMQAQKSGWRPAGFYWNALAKGYKLGVQSSSDHWSTHISYACLLVEGAARENLLDAIRKRHSYAATDNIILDFRARAGGREYLMGDIFTADAAPQLAVNIAGTSVIKQIDIIRDRKFIYTSRQGAKSANFTFTDAGKEKGESWYYVRVLQEDGQLAWSSPIWITLR